jgi:hypothetical protein
LVSVAPALDAWIAQVDPPRRTTSAFFPRNMASSRRSCGSGAIIQQDRPPFYVARRVFPESFGIWLPVEAANLCAAAPARCQEMRQVAEPRSAKTGHFLGCFADFEQCLPVAERGPRHEVRSHRFAPIPENMAIFSKHFDVFPKRTCGMHSPARASVAELPRWTAQLAHHLALRSTQGGCGRSPLRRPWWIAATGCLTSPPSSAPIHARWMGAEHPAGEQCGARRIVGQTPL